MEPMTLGSPVNSPGSSNQSQYLPPFLMGDPQALTPHNNTLSPKPGSRYNVSFVTSPGQAAQTPQDYNRHSSLSTRTLFGSGPGSPAPGAAVGNVANNSTANASLSTGGGHQTGPPTQGLFDHLREPGSTPQRSHLSVLQLQSPNLSLSQSYQNDSFVPNAPNAINASMRALCSPLGANMSPLMAPHTPRGSDFWVTIFGFSPGASSMVLQHFTLCGTIVDVVQAPQNGNWMHVRFSSRIESDKALNYNHKIIAGNVMVGVTRCSDKNIVDKENHNGVVVESGGAAASSAAALNTPKVRPFAQQSYKLAQNESTVSPNSKNVPQKSSGLVNKAMDLFFGW